MARFVLFLILLVPVVVVGNWLLANPGTVQVAWLGYDISMHVAILAAMLALLCVALVTIISLLWHLAGWPQRRRARRRYRTLARGLTQLTHGVTALALGDESAASSSLKKAVALLPHEPLPTLLTAQLLQRQGKHEAARTHLRALLKHASTAMLASKRLIEQHTSMQEWESARALAEQIHHENPRERWLVLHLVDLYARLGNTRAMLALTEGFQWQSPLTKPERHRFAAIAYYLQSRQQEQERLQRTSLRHAVGFAPDFLPALIDYAGLLMQAGEYRAARKWLLSAWARQPHATLITPILRSIETLSPKAQTRLLRPFLDASPANDAALLRARHALLTNDAASAEAALSDSLTMNETREACLCMADTEKLLRGDEAANRWLERAMRAPLSEAWICDACGHSHAAWQAHCTQCDAFDRIALMRPEARITSVELATL